MGWIHDDENDSSGFHRGFEGGGTMAEDTRSPEAKAADLAACLAREAKRESSIAELLAMGGKDAFEPLAPLAARKKVLVPWYDEYEGTSELIARPAADALGWARDVFGAVAARWLPNGLAFVNADGALATWGFACGGAGEIEERKMMVIADASTA